jgi:ubiquinone/menaquinone biosynthesis C-methylase UbiE
MAEPHSHHFHPDRRYVLLREERYQAMPPERVLGWLPLRPDATVADIGCGPGFFSLPLAERLPRGTLYAVDLEPVMLDTVRERMEAAGLTNIRLVRATEDRVPLDPAALDGAFLSMVYHEIADRPAYLAMLGGLLRPDGWLAILDWEKRQNPGGGPPLERRLAPEEVAADLDAAGWAVVARHAPHEWSYLLLARRR